MTCSSTGYSSPSVTLVRNPRPPRFTPRIGTLCPPSALAADSRVPSPPSTTRRSTLSASDSRGVPSIPASMQSRVSLSTSVLILCSRSHASSAGTMAHTISFIGLLTIPTVLIMVATPNSTLLALPGVEKILLVAFCARQSAGPHAENLESALRCRRGDAVDRFFVESRVANDPPFADFALFEFELRLDQNQKISLRSGDRRDGGQHFSCGDERYVHGNECRRLGDVAGGQISSVALHRDDARILPQFPVQLIDRDVDGVDLARTILQKTIRESAGGAAHIEADFASR